MIPFPYGLLAARGSGPFAFLPLGSPDIRPWLFESVALIGNHKNGLWSLILFHRATKNPNLENQRFSLFFEGFNWFGMAPDIPITICDQFSIVDGQKLLLVSWKTHQSLFYFGTVSFSTTI